MGVFSLVVTRRSAAILRRAPVLFGTLVCLAGLLASVFPAPLVAHASIGHCASDPIVYLSDGTEIDMDVAIDDSSSDVRQVTFTLHAPVGTHVVASISGSLGAKEVWTVLADNAPKTYDTVTDVATNTPGVQVQATTQALGLLGLAAMTTPGEDDQPLAAHVTI